MPRNLYSYVVAHDSGFAPNPFHDFCTLATCKPIIRRTAQVGDWVVGTGSDEKRIRRGGYLVYAMCVTETLSTSEYWHDPRFNAKKPNQFHNSITASGDNIYEPLGKGRWCQLNSYHSQKDGSPDSKHIKRDTGVERILVSDNFVYFGGEGPHLPPCFLEEGKLRMICIGRHHRRFSDEPIIVAFQDWIRSLDRSGYQGKPWDWVKRRA